MGNGNIPYFFRIRKFTVGLPLAGNGNIPYFFRIQKFAIGFRLQETATSKTVECFGEQKIYGYKYDNCFGNDYPDNRLSKILLPGDTAGVVFIKSS